MPTTQQSLLDAKSSSPPSRVQSSSKPAGKRSTSKAAATPRAAARGAYTADDIKLLAGLEAVRLRPAMYIGDNGAGGLMHLIWEIIDNGVDEAVAGFCNRIDVTLHSDGSIEISDNGRGIPVGKHPDKGVSALEVVFTELHSGRQVRSGRLHGVWRACMGVGAAVVNAMSRKLEAEVLRKGKVHKLSFCNQEPGHFTGSSFKKGHRLEVKQTGPQGLWHQSQILAGYGSLRQALPRSMHPKLKNA